LLLYGRKDSTISYMGANIYPQDIEYGLYQHAESARMIESFCLSLEETANLEQRVTVNIELRETVLLAPAERAASIAGYQQGIVDYLARINRDFAQSLAEDPSTGDIQIRIFDYGTGIFAHKNTRIKNKYLVRETT
jgi:phenylacetate-CoA ligase